MNVLSFGINRDGRDFVVGDIHGEFSLLEKSLSALGFDRSVDRLFGCGDLIDRGPESERVIEYLAADWFFSVKGNHDALPMQALDGLLEEDEDVWKEWVENLGGDWARRVPLKALKEIAIALSDLPVVMEIETVNGLMGISHAEPEIGADWSAIKLALENGHRNAIQRHLWSRERIKTYRSIHQSSPAWAVPGVDRLFMGHNIVGTPTLIENLHYIDTGAFSPVGALSLVEISVEGFREYVFPHGFAQASKKGSRAA